MMPLAHPAARMALKAGLPVPVPRNGPARCTGRTDRAEAEARRDVMAATNQEDARDAAAQAGLDGDPLPSWREGASRQAILDFVERVTTEGGPDAVPLQERVAVFDNDGTLWCEKPMPIQLDFILRRLVAMAEQDPALRTRQPWQAAYDKDYQWLGEVLTKHYHGDDSDVRVLGAGVLQAFAGITVEEFEAQADAFLRTAQHPTLGVPWVVDLGWALRSAGLDVLMWAGLQQQRDHIGRAGLELAPGELLAAAAGRGAQLEGITAVLLLTDEDDFNALASTTLQGNLDGLVCRAAPRPRGPRAPRRQRGPLRRPSDRVRHQPAAPRRGRDRDATGGGRRPRRLRPAFVVRANGRLVPVTAHGRPALENGDTLVLLGPAPQAAPDDRHRSTTDRCRTPLICRQRSASRD